MLKIRAATVEDVGLILQLVRELAEYERAPQSVVATEEDFRRDGFGPEPKYKTLIAEWNGAPAGFALYCLHYSTWLGRAGIFLEDLFVKPEFRGHGIGKALMAEVAAIACTNQYYGVKWEVLDWNQPAIDFYERLGAQVRRDWLPVRITGEGLRKLGEEATCAGSEAKV
ncbi:MAG TPA: GNAT family N-acetyltransferase [Terriglobales bacterium]|nr:GNAT family N-acetyltransferase [Terriglobales bacterium]